jgi:hypothetical protein
LRAFSMSFNSLTCNVKSLSRVIGFPCLVWNFVTTIRLKLLSNFFQLSSVTTYLWPLYLYSVSW